MPRAVSNELMVIVKVVPCRGSGVSHSYSVCAADRVGHGGERRIVTRRWRSRREQNPSQYLYATLCAGFLRGTIRWIVRRTKFLRSRASASWKQCLSHTSYTSLASTRQTRPGVQSPVRRSSTHTTTRAREKRPLTPSYQRACQPLLPACPSPS